MASTLSRPLTWCATALATPLALSLADGESGAVPGAASAPSSLLWSDIDADGRLDAFVVQPDGAGRMLLGRDDGTFEDATERLGLGEATGHHMAAFADADGDGRLDLFLPARRGPSRLYVQTPEGTFVDATESAGLPRHAEALGARWLDFDADGDPDLWLTTAHDDPRERAREPRVED